MHTDEPHPEQATVLYQPVDDTAPPATPALPTDRHVGDFELLAELGRGGMGVVYRARQHSLGRTVALKMLLAGHFASPVEVRRFQTEAEAAAKLQHPHIVAVFAVGEAGGSPYYAMEYVAGRSLCAHLRDGPLPPVKAAAYLLPLAEAIDYAHQAGVIHRDLKPSNVLIDADDRPRLTDFGLAKQLDADQPTLTQTGTIMGTPGYMAPEQAAGKVVGPAADVYALGAVLYECLTGRPPFEAASGWETMQQVIYADVVPPRLVNPAVPPEMDAIVVQCLEKDPARRYASAADLAADLRRWRDGEPVQARTGANRLMRLLLRESRHTEVMERWGRVFMAQAVVILIASLIASVIQWLDVQSYGPFIVNLAVEVTGLLAAIWYFRVRRGQPMTPVERQLAQIWIILMMTIILTIKMNFMMGFRPYYLAPLALLQAAVAFGAMAAILGGTFYWVSALSMIGAMTMARYPGLGPVVVGVVFGVGLFIPGWRYGRRRR
jgi:serine/threonine-protein kinase